MMNELHELLGCGTYQLAPGVDVIHPQYTPHNSIYPTTPPKCYETMGNQILVSSNPVQPIKSETSW